MKRAAAAFVLVAGLGGCMTATPGTKQPPPTTATPADTRGVTPAGGRGMTDRSGEVIHAAALGVDRVTTDPNVRQANGYGKLDPQTYGPTQSGLGMTFGHGGILPAPQMGPWGAVALVPGAATGPGGGAGGLYANGRTSIHFISTPSTSKMRIGFQDAARGWVDALAVPEKYNFAQGNIYRLRLSGIPNRPETVLYPTLEVYPANRETVTFLAHSTVPNGFTDEDFDQVKAGNMVVKVIYLPSAQFQDVAAAEEIVSTRLEPGADPVVEATRRGTVLAVIRLGNINLENQNSPAMDAPSGFGPPPGPGGPGMMPPPGGMRMPAPGPIGSTPIPPAPMPEVKSEPKKTAEVPSRVNRGVPDDLPPISLPTPKK
jgi:hypothetical protein